MLLLSCGPALAFVATYQARARVPLRFYELPMFSALFCVYGYHWVISQMWALARMTTRRTGWAKTPRVLPIAATQARVAVARRARSRLADGASA